MLHWFQINFGECRACFLYPFRDEEWKNLSSSEFWKEPEEEEVEEVSPRPTSGHGIYARENRHEMTMTMNRISVSATKEWNECESVARKTRTFIWICATIPFKSFHRRNERQACFVSPSLSTHSGDSEKPLRQYNSIPVVVGSIPHRKMHSNKLHDLFPNNFRCWF